ncbi:MAG: fumarylacetoacetate hydrolase family protein [Acidimicrobiia bacterium]|nr:fumarylacetoacetate hydrolase family protein [Acidimicrobiia bacterium]
MRLASFDGRIHAIDGDFDDPATRASDLAALTGLSPDPVEFLAAGGVEAAREALAAAPPGRPIEAFRVDPVVHGPRSVWAAGLNYRDHAAETGQAIPPAPALFTKSPGSLIAHGASIVVPPHVEQPDYEGEVAVVIGRDARDVDEAEALDFVAGVTIGHDVSARDHQFVTGQFSWSKSFDTFCPLGPVLVTLDEVDVFDLPIETRLNGEVVQSSTTAHLAYSIPRLVAWITQGLTLLAGDVILTGTPAGVGVARDPQRFLTHGDVVEITVAGVGTLRNPVVRHGPPLPGS